MKNLGLIMITAFVFSCNSTKKIAEVESTTEKPVPETAPPPASPQGIPVAHNQQFLKEFFNETYNNVVLATNGLSNEQLNFKPAPDRWSILECLEHIVVSQPGLFDYAKTALAKPQNPEKRREIKVTDDGIMTMMVDRSFKAKASKEATPTGKYKDITTALAELKKQQTEILAYANQYSMDDLRNHVLETPMGMVDGYQFMLVIPGHVSRHTLQMQEVKQDPNFPKN